MKKVDRSHWYFLIPLIVLVILGIYQCFTMANAFNLSPFTYQMRERGVSANYAYISGDTLYMNNMAVSVAAVLKAVALQADTLRGSSNIVGILDSALRIDPDSSSAVNVITFGGYGGGLRWNRATDKVQFTNDFSTWTDIGSGSGSSTTNADSLGHKVVRVRPLTDNYYVKYDSDGDSLYLAAAAGGGSDEDSTFNAHRSQRWLPHPSLSGQYIGASTDSGFAEHVDSTSGNSYTRYWTPIWYWEIVPDSALPTWGRVEAAIAANGGGDITGIIANDWLTGSASSGDVSLGIDPDLLAAIYLEADTTVIEGTAVKIRNNDGMTQVKLDNDTVLVQNLNSGAVVLNVFGSPTDYDELVITENTLTTRTIGSWRVVYTNGSYQLTGATVGAANTVLVGNGTSSAPSFRALTDADIPDNITITETGDISSVVAGSGLTGGATSGAATVDVVGGWSMRVFADSIAVRQITGDSITAGTVADARIATTLFRDSEFTDSVNANRTHSGVWTISGNWVNTANPWADNEVANNLTVDDAGIAATIMRDSEWNDSIAAARTMANIVTITGNWVNTTNPWAVNEGGTGAATFTQNGILYGNGTSAIGVTAQGASGTVLHGNAGTPTFSAVVSADITDGTIALGDMASNSVDSTKIVDASIGSGDIGTGRITTTHILDASLVGGDMATGTIDSIRLGTACVKAAELDTTVTYTVGSLRTRLANNGGIFSNNYQVRDADSTLKIGGAAGLTISSNLRYGTDITDDTIWVDYYPEPQSVTLGDRIMPTYKDSMKIYGDVDSCGNLGNVIVFSDSLLNSGNHRRSLHYTITHPHNVDTLRYILVYGLVKDSSGTNEMYLRGALRTTPWTRSCADSLTAGNIKDYDSLGGDFGDNQVKRSFALTGGAVTAGGAWYLLLTGRHDAGTAYNWAEVGLIRCVYSKLGPD